MIPKNKNIPFKFPVQQKKTSKITISVGHWSELRAYHSILNKQIWIPKPVKRLVHINTFQKAPFPFGKNKHRTWDIKRNN